MLQLEEISKDHLFKSPAFSLLSPLTFLPAENRRSQKDLGSPWSPQDERWGVERGATDTQRWPET